MLAWGPFKGETQNKGALTLYQVLYRSHSHVCWDLWLNYLTMQTLASFCCSKKLIIGGNAGSQTPVYIQPRLSHKQNTKESDDRQTLPVSVYLFSVP